MPSRLESEIKQSRPFSRRSEEALVSIMRTAAYMDHGLQDALREFGITPTQYNVLRILRGAGREGLCGREIGERLISKVPDVSRLLDRMEEMGLMTRERDLEDRRHVTARATPKGLRILVEAEPALEALERQYLGTVSAGSLKVLIETLDTIRTPRP
ncbi:MAG TPA: MarR family transcriptional regulator [Gemmatimonadales bacterium]|nr:MarR family transcriptional regulator [Gemmatimonadales bacterium]